MNIKHVASKLITTTFAIALLVGCSSNNQKSEDYEVFVDMIRDYAMEPESPDGIIHSRAATTEERKSEYKVIYVDAQFASYWCEDWTYTGGAHGNTVIHVGTLNRKTGKKITLDDLLSKDQQNELAKELRQKANEILAKKEQQLFSFVTDAQLLTNNFCLKDDGCWHFIYNPYDIAPYSAGVIDVAISR